jgi:hypothetical protein
MMWLFGLRPLVPSSSVNRFLPYRYHRLDSGRAYPRHRCGELCASVSPTRTDIIGFQNQSDEIRTIASGLLSEAYRDHRSNRQRPGDSVIKRTRVVTVTVGCLWGFGVGPGAGQDHAADLTRGQAIEG